MFTDIKFQIPHYFVTSKHFACKVNQLKAKMNKPTNFFDLQVDEWIDDKDFEANRLRYKIEYWILLSVCIKFVKRFVNW